MKQLQGWVAFGALMMSNFAAAGDAGSITAGVLTIGYSGSAVGGAGASIMPVPTLSGSLLIGLALLLGVIGLRLLKIRQGSVSSLAIAALASMALASGVGGIKVISDANANGGGIFLVGDFDETGEVSVVLTPMQQFGPNYYYADFYVTFTNQLNSDVTVTSVLMTPDTEQIFCQDIEPTETPVCEVGTLVEPAQSCQVALACTNGDT